jgi:BASS family bile acid:Na+ symporter
VAEMAGVSATFNVTVMVSAYALARTVGLHLGDRIAYVMGFSARNVAVAIVVASTTLGRLDYAVFVAAYFMTQMVITIGVIALFRRWVDPLAPPVTA